MDSKDHIDQIKLHDDIEDGAILKKWIRVTSIADKELFYFKVRRIIQIIKKHRNLRNWIEFKEFLSRRLNANVNITTLYGLRGGKFNGKSRDGIPLKILHFLIQDYCYLTHKNFEVILKEFYRITDSAYAYMGEKAKLVKFLGTDLCYLLGMTVADGSCPNSFSRKNKEYRTHEIRISKDSLIFIQKLANMFYIVFDIKPHIFRDKHSENVWILSLKSKYVFRLFTKLFEIPIGSKSKIVRMPKLIQESTKKNQFSFIKGVIDGDGCIYSYIQKGKKQTYRDFLFFRVVLRVRSEMLVRDIANILRDYGFYVKEFSYLGNSYSKDFTKKYKIRFYGLYLQSKNAEKYAEEIGSLNPTKIRKISEYYQKAAFLQR